MAYENIYIAVTPIEDGRERAVKTSCCGNYIMSNDPGKADVLRNAAHEAAVQAIEVRVVRFVRAETFEVEPALDESRHVHA